MLMTPRQLERRSFLKTIMKKSASSRRGNVFSSPIIETESFKALKICIKNYCDVYASSFQEYSTFFMLDGHSLNESIRSPADYPYSNRRELVKTNSDYDVFSSQVIVNLLKIGSSFMTLESDGHIFGSLQQLSEWAKCVNEVRLAAENERHDRSALTRDRIMFNYESNRFLHVRKMTNYSAAVPSRRIPITAT